MLVTYQCWNNNKLSNIFWMKVGSVNPAFPTGGIMKNGLGRNAVRWSTRALISQPFLRCFRKIQLTCGRLRKQWPWYLCTGASGMSSALGPTWSQRDRDLVLTEKRCILWILFHNNTSDEWQSCGWMGGTACCAVLRQHTGVQKDDELIEARGGDCKLRGKWLRWQAQGVSTRFQHIISRGKMGPSQVRGQWSRKIAWLAISEPRQLWIQRIHPRLWAHPSPGMPSFGGVGGERNTCWDHGHVSQEAESPNKYSIYCGDT